MIAESLTPKPGIREHNRHSKTFRRAAQIWQLSEPQRTRQERREHVDPTKVTHLCHPVINFAVTHNAALW
jgi:hypothetical protein